MATNDNSDIEARLARLEEQLVPADEMTPEQKAEADKQAVEQQQEFEAEIQKRADDVEASRKKEEEERAAREEKIRAEVDQRNKDNGANEELVDPEPDPLPEPPPLHNDNNNLHNDGSLDVGPAQDGHAEPEPLDDLIAREEEQRRQWLEEHGMSPQAPEVQPVVTE